VPALLDVNADAGTAIVRAAERSRGMRTATMALAEALLEAWGAEGSVDVRMLAPLPPPARQELLARWLRRSVTGRGLTSRIVLAVDRLAVLPGRSACASVDLPGTTCVRRDGYHLSIVATAPRHGGPHP